MYGILAFGPALGWHTPLIRAQSVLEVDAKALQQHIDHKVFPVYPPIAKAAHVQGTVVFDLRIGTAGKIDSMKVVSGPPMLQQAAIDCLKQWTFHPFQKDGISVAAQGQYSILFVLGDSTNTTIGHGPQAKLPVKTATVKVMTEDGVELSDSELGKRFLLADDGCKKGILAKQYEEETATLCKQAAELAEQLPSEGSFIIKRSAYVYAATALANKGDFLKALPWANKAVEIVKLGHDGDSGSNAVYSTKGTIEGMLGDLTTADRDLTVAEDYMRKAVAQAEQDKSEYGSYDGRILARDLRFHAQVLQGLHCPDEAQKKLDEAGKYN